MGLSCSAQTFQRLLDSIMDGLDNVFVYLDDLMIHAATKKKHDETLEEVLRRLQAAGLSISLDKCSFGKSSIDYLGYRVDKSGIQPLARKISAIKDLPPPKGQKQLLHYLGAINYFRSSLDHLPDLATSLFASYLQGKEENF